MDIRYGIAEDIGYREHMEDTYAVWDTVAEFYGAEVYDGHAGGMAARLAAEFLMPHFISAYNRMRMDTPERIAPVVDLIREAYLATDRYILARGVESGTAAATLYIRDEHFYAANAGDSRVVIGTAAGAAQVTLDHKPNLPEERARIEAVGGVVLGWDVPRVQGVLAMSRALGDPSLKPWVSPEPRVVEGLLGTENDIALLACDGVWDVMTPLDAMAIAREEHDPQRASERVVRSALERGTTDNVTVIVLDLRPLTATLSRGKMEIVHVLDRAADRYL